MVWSKSLTVMALGVALQAGAVRAEPLSTMAQCNAFTDGVTALLRAGEVERANRYKPDIERCLKVMRSIRKQHLEKIERDLERLRSAPTGERL